MKIAEAKEAFRSLVAEYFGDSHVFFAESKMARLPEPYLTIKFIGYTRQEHEVRRKRADYHVEAIRELRASIDLNLYTKGSQVDGNVYASTALDDMEGFINFLESDYAQGIQMQNDFAIITGNPQDVSVLLRDSQYQYRAYLSVEMRFADAAWGEYGQNSNELPNASGGGDESMITDPYYIDTVTINDEITVTTETEEEEEVET